MSDVTGGSALKAFKASVEERRPVSVKAAFADDPERFARFHVDLGDLLFDYSKHRVDDEIVAKLVQLARDSDLEAKRDRMFSGRSTTRPSSARRCTPPCATSPAGR